MKPIYLELEAAAKAAALSETTVQRPKDKLTMTEITITATLDDANVAEQLAELCKRSTFQTFYDFTEAHLPDEERRTRAYQMIRGIERVQQSLAAAGYSPR